MTTTIGRERNFNFLTAMNKTYHDFVLINDFESKTTDLQVKIVRSLLTIYPWLEDIPISLHGCF